MHDCLILHIQSVDIPSKNWYSEKIDKNKNDLFPFTVIPNDNSSPWVCTVWISISYFWPSISEVIFPSESKVSTTFWLPESR